MWNLCYQRRDTLENKAKNLMKKQFIISNYQSDGKKNIENRKNSVVSMLILIFLNLQNQK